jgi:hypothetical protein
MKKLITLLTLVLSFSFADAKSIWIEVIHFKKASVGDKVYVDDHKVEITIIFRKENSFNQRENFSFQADIFGTIIASKTNEEKWNKLNLLISDKLKLKSQNGSKRGFFATETYTLHFIKGVFLTSLIGDDWMITHLDDNNIDEVNIFAYKQN